MGYIHSVKRNQTHHPKPRAYNGPRVRSRDKGFLNLDWQDYLALLRWTAKQRVKESVGGVPAKLQSLLTSVGIDAGVWRDLVWEYKRYFGRSSCAGRPESLVVDAERVGKRFHRGQRQLRESFPALAAT